jgi:omega-6 fatty acid desaturase (delta-12 desaturase)
VRVEATLPAWKTTLDAYAVANGRRSAAQILLTLVLFTLGFALMARAMSVGYWLVLALAIPTAAMQVRLFTLFHEATHYSLFTGRRANQVVGVVLGLPCFTPYFQWGRRHALHHATSGNLDRRGWWEIPTLTTREYEQAGRGARLSYRLTRGPLLFSVIPFAFFAVVQRFGVPGARRRERVGVWATDAALVGIVVGAIWLFGPGAFLGIWLPVAALAAIGGFWLFYVQHQFEKAYWVFDDEWSFVDAALRGSSYLQLPVALEWLTLSIGYHHIHHLNPRIPNYRLAEAHRDNPEFHEVTTMGLRQSWGTTRANLWDGRRMTAFRSRDARTLP